MGYIKNATQEEIDEVRKKVDFNTYFYERVIPVYPESFHYGDFETNGNKCGCPIHGESTPSFHLRTWNDGTTTFKCFGCDIHGDIIKFHVIFEQHFNNRVLNYYQSAKELYDEFILGKLVTRKIGPTKIKLKSDEPIDLSSIMEQAHYYMKYYLYESILVQKELDVSKVSKYYSYIDKLTYLVQNNLLNATIASECLEDAYQEVINNQGH